MLIRAFDTFLFRSIQFCPDLLSIELCCYHVPAHIWLARWLNGKVLTFGFGANFLSDLGSNPRHFPFLLNPHAC